MRTCHPDEVPRETSIDGLASKSRFYFRTHLPHSLSPPPFTSLPFAPLSSNNQPRHPRPPPPFHPTPSSFPTFSLVFLLNGGRGRITCFWEDRVCLFACLFVYFLHVCVGAGKLFLFAKGFKLDALMLVHYPFFCLCSSAKFLCICL